MPSKNVSVGGKGVLTESDFEKLEQENKKLKKQRIYFVIIGAILSQILGLLIRKFLW